MRVGAVAKTGKAAGKAMHAIRCDVISRPRLLALFDQVLVYPVSVLQAPAGYGKTTLARQWAARADAVCVFVDAGALAAGDILAAFAAGLASAACPADSDRETDAASLALADNAASVAHALAAAGSVSNDVVVVLDDVASCGCSCDEAYRFFSALPANVHVVMLSRGCVNAGLARLSMDGSLFQLGADELCCTELETRETMQVAGVGAAADAASLVHRLTCGWPAGIRMACTAAKRFPDVRSARFRAMLLRETLDYVEETVLPRVSADVAQLIESLSYIETCTEDLACSLMDWDDTRTAAALRRAVDEGAFLFRTDDPAAGGYAMHPLVAEAFSLHTAFAGVGRAQVLSRACAYFDERGQIDRVVELAARAGDWDCVASAIARRWRTMFAEARSAELLRWFELMPREYVLAHPKLATVEALPLAVFGQQIELYENLRVAMPDDDAAADGELPYLYWSVRCVALASVGDSRAAREAGHRALVVLPETEEYLRAMVKQSLGGAGALQDPAKACRLFQEAAPLLVRTGLRNPLCSAYANAARLCAHIGYGDDALDAAARAGALAEGFEPMQAMYAQAVLAKAQVSYDRGNTVAAKEALAWLSAAQSMTRIPEHTAAALALSALVYREQADEAAATDAITAASLLSPAGVVRSFAPLSALRDWVSAGVFSIRPALSEIVSASESSPYAEVLVLSVRYAQGCLAASDAQRASELVRLVEPAPRYQVRALVLAALAFESEGFSDRAEAALEQAFCIAEPLRLERTFVDEADIAPIWHRIVRTCSANAWAAQLYRRSLSRTAPKASPAAAASLTDRELDVMRAAAQGLTVQQIADELFVSRDTVKKHLSNVYQKLAVHTKLQAVSALRDRGVL